MYVVKPFAVLMRHLAKSLFLFAFIIASLKVFTQKTDDYLYWSATRKLTAKDFVIKTSGGKTTSSFAQFFFSYEVRSSDFMTKNFNNKVHNCLIPSASWIDTSYDINTSLRYQQTLFDLSEIYARRFRKDLKGNRKKLLKGTDFVKELNTKQVTDFSKRRVDYDSETQFAINKIMQERWESLIQLELDQLKEFAVEEK